MNDRRYLIDRTSQESLFSELFSDCDVAYESFTEAGIPASFYFPKYPHVVISMITYK